MIELSVSSDSDVSTSESKAHVRWFDGAGRTGRPQSGNILGWTDTETRLVTLNARSKCLRSHTRGILQAYIYLTKSEPDKRRGMFAYKG